MLVEFRMLGPIEAEVAGTAVQLGGPRPRLVLAALLLELGRTVATDRLIDWVWDTDVPASARTLIAVHVSNLRKAFAGAGGPQVIETVPGGYRIAADAVALDVTTVDDLLARARAATAEDRDDRASALLGEALALWRGPVLDLPRTPQIEAAAARLEELRLVATEERAEAELRRGRHREMTAELTSFVAAYPLRERARAALMTALWRSGRQAEALDAYAAGRRLLVDELGIEPGPELRQVQQAILREDEPVREIVPALDAIVAEPSGRVPYPAGLPPAVSAFTGRTAEREALNGLLTQSGRHLPVAVISGLGGVGKTALAIDWAHEVADRFPDGTLYVSLNGYAPATPPLDSATALNIFLFSLGVPGERIPEGPEERAAMFRAMLDGRRMLIVLDDAVSEAQVRPLLPSTPKCCVVVTARRRLEGLVTDGAIPVPLDVMADDEATELLRGVIGAERTVAEAEGAAALIGMCGGLPLALRIAAARLVSRPGWTLAELAGRLAAEEDRLDELGNAERQVRLSFQLSYGDLPPPAQRAFRLIGLLDQLASFTPLTVAALLDDTVGAARRCCEQLVDAQLLRPLGGGAGRPLYGLHDLVRLYAKECAEREEPADEREAAILRYLRCLLGGADASRAIANGDARSGSIRGDNPVWPAAGTDPRHVGGGPYAWADGECSNVLSAVRQAVNLGHTGIAWDLVARFIFLYEGRSYYENWREASELALDACRRAGDVHGEAAMLYSLGNLALNMRRLDVAERRLNASIVMFERLGQAHSSAVVLRHLGTLHALRGEYGRALEGLTTAAQAFNEAGDTVAEAHALGMISHIHMLEGRHEEAQELLERGLEIAPGSNTRVEAMLLKRLAEVYLRRGRATAAVALCGRVLEFVRDNMDAVGMAYALLTLGEAQRAAADPGAAARTLGQAVRHARGIGEPVVEGRALLELGRLGGADARDHLRAAAQIFEQLGAAAWLDATQAELRTLTPTRPTPN